MNPVQIELEVRWGECDPAGIVYHPNYLDWFSVARMKLLAANGVPYMKTFHESGVVLVVLTAQCEFRQVLRAEALFTVEASLTSLSRTRMAVKYAVKDANGNICGVGTTAHAFVDLNHKPVNVSRKAPALWRMLEPYAI